VKAAMKNNPAMETSREFHVVSPPQWYLITLPYADLRLTLKVWKHLVRSL